MRPNNKKTEIKMQTNAYNDGVVSCVVCATVRLDIAGYCVRHSMTTRQFHRQSSSVINCHTFLFYVFRRPFVKRLALCYRTVVLSLSCPVCDVGALWPNGWMDQDEAWHAGRPRPWPHCVTWRISSRKKKGTAPPTFRPMSIVAQQLDGSRCH